MTSPLGTKLLRRREKNVSMRKFLDGAKIFEKPDRVVAIDFVQKSSKSELSSRFFGRLKFSFAEATNCPAWKWRSVLRGNDESSGLEMTNHPAWKRRIVVLGNDESSCLEMTNWPARYRRTILLGDDEFSCVGATKIGMDRLGLIFWGYKKINGHILCSFHCCKCNHTSEKVQFFMTSLFLYVMFKAYDIQTECPTQREGAASKHSQQREIIYMNLSILSNSLKRSALTMGSFGEQYSPTGASLASSC